MAMPMKRKKHLYVFIVGLLPGAIQSIPSVQNAKLLHIAHVIVKYVGIINNDLKSFLIDCDSLSNMSLF